MKIKIQSVPILPVPQNYIFNYRHLNEINSIMLNIPEMQARSNFYSGYVNDKKQLKANQHILNNGHAWPMEVIAYYQSIDSSIRRGGCIMPIFITLGIIRMLDVCKNELV
jgi:hypothetical protein